MAKKLMYFNEFIDSLKSADYRMEFGTYLDDLSYAARTGTLPDDIFAAEPEWDDDILAETDQALFAASAHHLSIKYKLKYPSWCFKERYFLKDPFFPTPAKKYLRVILMIESPKAFKMRNIFVSENALEVA